MTASVSISSAELVSYWARTSEIFFLIALRKKGRIASRGAIQSHDDACCAFFFGRRLAQRANLWADRRRRRYSPNAVRTRCSVPGPVPNNMHGDEGFYFGYVLFMTVTMAIACLAMGTARAVCRREQRRLSPDVHVLV